MIIVYFPLKSYPFDFGITLTCAIIFLISPVLLFYNVKEIFITIYLRYINKTDLSRKSLSNNLVKVKMKPYIFTPFYLR